MTDPLTKQTILIVDDTPQNIYILLDVLRNDYKIKVALNGEKAISIALSETPPDLILLDIVMPGIDGYEVIRKIKSHEKTKDIPVIFLTAKEGEADEEKGLLLGAADYITKPVNPPIVKARVKTHLALYNQSRALEEKVQQRTAELEVNKRQLQKAVDNLQTTQITTGVYWVKIPEAGLHILCGCPGEIVKHLMLKGYISTENKGDTICETGPNAILLSDVLIQNGGFANLAEFPVLQMLYRQGLILPNHPNNTGAKPILIGSEHQLKAQMAYIHRGNYGLLSKEEIMATGTPETTADEMMRIKMKFKFDKILFPEELLESINVDRGIVEIRNGVFIRRTGFNQFEFSYNGKTSHVDLNLTSDENYASPYTLGFHNIRREYFAVIHSGQGDGWDIHRPSMGSILMYQGGIYLIDAPPNILYTLRSLGIDISEIEGIFHTHAHDDHFAGLPTLLMADHRIKYFATPLVRASVTKKFSALMSMDENLFAQFFDIHDLLFDQWNDYDGLEVMPIYSPHPVETNLFLFRTLGEDGYKSYAHFADIIALDLLKKWVGNRKEDITDECFKRIKANYLIPATQKKLDVGGGQIHGCAHDFRYDRSDKIILAHKSSALSNEEKEIGSESSFGAVDKLISNSRDYLQINASKCLKSRYPSVPEKSLHVLIYAKTISFNDGTIILKKGCEVSHIFLILMGSIEYINSENNIHYMLSNGCFIGEHSFFSDSPSPGTYRAISHATVLCIPKNLFYNFLQKNHIYEETKTLFRNIQFLQTSWLFGEGSSYSVQNKIAQRMKLITIEKGDTQNPNERNTLYLIKEGLIKINNLQNQTIATIKAGDFFGENSFFQKDHSEFKISITEAAKVYVISDCSLLDIPIVHLKMLEVNSKRRNLLENTFL